MEFRSITLCDKALIDGIRRKAGHTASSHAFVSLYLWRHAMSLSVALFEDAFLVKSKEGYFFPCGDKERVVSLVKRVLEEEESPRFLYARKEDLALCEEALPGLLVGQFDSAAREYLYLREEQIAMQGKKFTYQRAKVNKARRLGETSSVPLDESLVPAAKKITEEWASRREDQGDFAETLDALCHMTELGMYGNLLSLDGKPVGFNLGSFLTEDTFDIHIAKTLVDDVDTLMKLELYKALPERVVTVNREEDLGIRGLAIHKQDGQPSGFNDMYVIFPVGKEENR